jgi:tRNA threonylcarbamoyladenosine biosynthesis protein TsaB
MALILNIETATEICSVALSNEHGLVDFRENTEGMLHASLLTVFVEDILKKNNVLPKQLDAIAVSAGPGSYTGLRIGVSASKGLCYGINKPLISVSTMQSMAYGFINQLSENKRDEFSQAWLCPMIDARRLEVYTAFFDIKGEFQSEVTATIIDETSYNQIFKTRKVIFFGNGSDKCKEIIKNENALFVSGFTSSARDMIKLSQQNYDDQNFKDVAYFEPYYLKEFVATTPKNKVL